MENTVSEVILNMSELPVKKSLQRLGVDTIDLYYCHRVDGITPTEQTVEAMVELKEYIPLLDSLLLRNIISQ